MGLDIEGAGQITGATDQESSDRLTAGPDALGAQAIVRLFCSLFGQGYLHQEFAVIVTGLGLGDKLQSFTIVKNYPQKG
ncbi:hypothetical protein A7E78_11255 [Syntrophotalea acetylenivorans]|uniref:Uncharacterized protein n=1 Tax=Syntrophotalea acetylenivorans TaxID=1842532 RepID=A0A1L3GQZ5_9BACT|nr:hypothetical protein A7E78_11255 [Syntrophotalea acetylenivorans]